MGQLEPLPHFIVCRACPTAWGCKSPGQPDGGEGLAKRKGVIARCRLKEAWSKTATRWTRTGYEASMAGRVSNVSRSPYPSKATAVNPAGVRRRRSGLPREVSGLVPLLQGGLTEPRGTANEAREVSRGHSREIPEGPNGR